MQQAKVVRAKYVSVRDQMDRIAHHAGASLSGIPRRRSGRPASHGQARQEALRGGDGIGGGWAGPKDLVAAHRPTAGAAASNRKCDQLEAFCS